MFGKLSNTVRILFLICLSIVLTFTAEANQLLDRMEINAKMAQVHIPYRLKKDSKGLWVKVKTETTFYVDADSITIVAKNNKLNTLYALTPTSVIELTLPKEEYKEYKKDKTIRNLSEEEWRNGISAAHIAELDRKMTAYNKIRTKEWNDSIEEAARIRQQKIEEDRRKEEIRRAEQIKEADSIFRISHPLDFLDIRDLKSNLNYSDRNRLLRCTAENCQYDFSDDFLCPVALKEDTLIFMIERRPILDIQSVTLHTMILSTPIRNSSNISQHLRAWGDSIPKLDSIDIDTLIKELNRESLTKFISKVKQEAPNGFVDELSWGNDYGPVSLDISFTNTNKKTIKYIKFFFSVYNDVDDVRGSGWVQGTGPVEEYSTGSWSFDRTGCWPRGDATTMKITKIVITYMNGSTATLTGKKILYN